MSRMLVNIDVDDLERGIRFYTEALGLRVERRFGLLQYLGRDYDEVATG